MADFCWECTAELFAPEYAEQNELAAVDLTEFYSLCEGCGAHAFVRGGIRTHAFNGCTLRCPECLGIEEDVA